MQASVQFQLGDLRARYCSSVADVGQFTWDLLHPGSATDWSYFRTVETVPPPGFSFGAIVVEWCGTIVAAAPVFRTVYRFDMAFQDASSARLRNIGHALFRHVPRLVSMDVLSVGSPMCDDACIGFSPVLDADGQRAAVAAMIDCLHKEACRQRVQLVAFKGLSDCDAEQYAPQFNTAGFAKVTTTPDVMLDLPFRNLDGYLASLPGKTSSYLKRKWRAAACVEIEHCVSIGGLEAEINAMFEATLSQSKVDYGDFSRVHPDYFSSVLETLGHRARFMLCRVDGELLSFQLYIAGETEVLAKGIGMKYPRAREYNLYFLNWREMISYCLERRIPRISMSGTTYSTKLLIGGRLERRWVYFRFGGRLMNMLLPRLAPTFDYEQNDPELRQLMQGERDRA